MASEYKQMGEFITDDQELLYLLKKNNCKAEGKRIRVQYSGSAFQILADLAGKGYRLYNPSLLALAWGISRQAVNNVINRGLLVTIEFNGGFTVEYKYIVFESIEAQGERTRRRSATPETYLGATTHPSMTAAEPTRDAAGLIQEELPLSLPSPGDEGLTAAQIKERDSICEGWRKCDFQETCFNLEINEDCICQYDDGAIPASAECDPLELARARRREIIESRKAPELPAKIGEGVDFETFYQGTKKREIVQARGPKLQEVVEALEVKVETTPATRAELYQEHPEEIPSVEGLKILGFDDNEIKILRGGFSLVRYYREEKSLRITGVEFGKGWMDAGTFPTYAAAERVLAEHLKRDLIVEVNYMGRTVNSKDEKKLRCAGFSFYRNAGMDYGEKFGRIKIGPSWSTYKKCSSDGQLLGAWLELMKDEKALEG